MFRKVEAYITPVLLSHVEKYVKDFKPEHTEVSLWSGSVSLHNLELRTDVIQREFNLPFNLASGHIHELTIQVPWTKIISEPIIVTVNTIECVLKLKESNSTEGIHSPVIQTSKDDLDAPPGYTQSLVNRIVNNIAFRCNNLILKYVEEDIVVSVNIKHLYLDSVNSDWTSAFTEMTIDDLHLRKLMRLSDLTLCLDKRNAAGKIETYLEPLLYRCELEFRLDNLYKSITSKRPSNTQISVHSPKLEFSISYQQIPMVMRLIALIYALKQKNIQIQNSENTTNIFSSSVIADQDSDNPENQQSWGGWIWSFVPQLPLGYDDESQDASDIAYSSIILISMNLEKVTFTFKIPEYINDTPGIYGGIKKIRYVPTCCLELSSILTQSSSIGFERFSFRGGIRSIKLYPNTCVCGIEENKENVILESLPVNTNSVFSSWPIEDDISCTVDTMTDSEMLAVSPAFAFSYLYKMSIPDDIEDTLKITEIDMEYSNYRESAFMKIVTGKFTVNICAGFLHRLSVIKSAIATYDYAPYYKNKPLLKFDDLPPPSTEDYDSLSEFVPNFNVQVVFQKPQVKLLPWDHPPHIPKSISSDSTNTIFGKRKISSNNDQYWYYEDFKGMPCLLLDAESIEISISKPMYPNRLTYVSCQLPEPAPLMMENCYSNLKIKIHHLRCFIQYKNSKNRKSSKSDTSKNVLTPIITDCTLYSSVKQLLLPEYWDHNSLLLLYDFTINIDNLSICGTMPKLMLAYHIIRLIHPEFYDTSFEVPVLLKTSLIKDATEDKGMPHLEAIIEGVSLRSYYLKNLVTHRIVINNLKLLAMQPARENTFMPQQIWIVSASDDNVPGNSPFYKGVIQLSNNTIHSSFATCKSEKIWVVLDPILFDWLGYKYNHYDKVFQRESSSNTTSKKSPSEKQLSTSRSYEDVFNRSGKISIKHSIGQSSSEREKDFIHGTSIVSQSINEVPSDAIVIQPQKQIVTNMSLTDRIVEIFYKWRYTAVFLELDSISVVFPKKTVSFVDIPTTKHNILKLNSQDGVLIVKLPTLIVKTAILKQNLLCYCVHGLPVKLPENVWEKETLSYPLNVSLSGLSCLTVLNDKQSEDININDASSLPILKEVSSTITITFTPKVNTVSTEDSDIKSGIKKSIVKENETEVKLCSLGVCVHIDTGSLIFSFCNYRVAIMTSILNRIINHVAIISTNNLKTVPNLSQNLKHPIRKTSEQSCDNQDFSNMEYSSTADSYNYKQNEVFLRQKTTLYSSYDELDSGIIRESLAETADTEDNLTELEVKSCNKLNLTGWFQWTISNILVKIYVSSLNNINNSNVPKEFNDLKLVICTEDIMASLDVQAEYFKLKSKIVTSSIHCFKKQNKSDPWKPNLFGGIIMTGRENENSGQSNDENCFVSITVTRARSASVHSKWGDLRKKTQKGNLMSNSYISELEISLQSLDVILSFASIEPFFAALLPYFVEINTTWMNLSKISKKSKHLHFLTNPYQWDSRKYPLCYLETNKIKVFIPLDMHSNESVFSQDVFILQIDKISMIPVADNPICRSPLRPDLYQKAARDCILNIPGSLLEDRQCQLTIKGISLQTAQWTHLETIFLHRESKEDMFGENPAFKWNNSDQDTGAICDPPITIIQTLDVCLVTALAMFQNQELVCGPSVDFSVLTDIDVSLCIQQINLLIDTIHKLKNFYDHWNTKTINAVIGHDKIIESPVTNSDLNNVFNFTANNSLISYSTSTDAVPLKIPTLKQTEVPKKFGNFNYFDLCITLGKINIYIYECIKEIPKNVNLSKYELKIFPLLHFGLHQPNFLYSIHNYSQTVQASIFSGSVNLSDEMLGHEVAVTKDEYELRFLETSLGMPNQMTGIPPALLTAKWECNIGNKNTTKIKIGCPMKFTMSTVIFKRIKKLLHLYQELTEKYSQENTVLESSNETVFKNYLNSFHCINLSTSQLVFCMVTLNNHENYEMNLSIMESQFNLSTFTRPDKIILTGAIDSIIMSINEAKKTEKKIIMLPWDVGLDCKVSLNHWQPSSFSIDSQSIEIILKADKLSINLNVSCCNMIRNFVNYWSEYQKTINNENNEQKTHKSEFDVKKENCFWDENTIFDQHYKDDLRAGAFKFIISSCGHPLPYQVFINPSGLIWKYPQPRAITRVHSFPVPFQRNDNSPQFIAEGVKCTLEYFCEVLNKFIVYSTFYLKQDKSVKLELEKFNQNIILSSIWKVSMHLEDEIENSAQNDVCYQKKYFLQSKLPEVQEKPKYNYDSFPVKAHTLAACLRIDSYFSPHLMNKIKLSLSISRIEISLYNILESISAVNSKTIGLYTIDSITPPPHVFFKITFDNNETMSRIWNPNTILFKASSQIKCEAVNGSNLSLYKILDIENANIKSWIGGRKEDEEKIELTLGRIYLSGGPHLTKPLINSLHLWQLYLNQDKQENKICLDCAEGNVELAIQKYIICNDTNILVRFGQEGTDEYIMLPSRHSYFYSWRSSSRDSLLRLAVQEGDWQSCKGFQIDKEGISTVDLVCSDDTLPKLTMIVLVDSSQYSQKIVTFMGRLIITNLLKNEFDFKIFQKNNQSHTMASPVFPIAADTRSPSLFVNNDHETTFRLKFFGSDNGWTGDIPLKECVKTNIPWLVKVPYATQYVSIWCRVILDNIYGRILVILSPLYIIKSHLPMSVSIKLSSENFENKSEMVIKGKGSLHAVNCPGTTATKHEMAFISCDNHVYAANNNVPFNFGLVNQTTFFPEKKDLSDIETILDNMTQWRKGLQADLPEWPYISDIEENWTPVDAQINTEVSIRYNSAVPGVDSMVVDLTPWALFANSVGLTVGIVDSENQFVCKIETKSVITPPSFLVTGAFYICLIEDDVTYLSEKLFLTAEVPGPYEKRPKGKIFINENTTFTIIYKNSVCKMCLSYEIKSNITIFHLSCKYNLCNKSSTSLCVLPISSSVISSLKITIPSDYDQLMFGKQKDDKRSLSIPVLQFHSIDILNEEDDCNLFLYFGTDKNSFKYSCPIQIDQSICRKSIAIKKAKTSIPLVITFQEIKGQIFITLHDDAYPQLQIKNYSKVPIFAGQTVPDSSLHETDRFLINQDPHSRKVLNECIKCDWHCLIDSDESVYYSMPMENMDYPDISQNKLSTATNSYLTLAYANPNANKELLWSLPINTKINTTEQFIKLPGYIGDIKVTVDCSFHITVVTIQNVTEIDISASEIRLRLMGNLDPKPPEFVEKDIKMTQDTVNMQQPSSSILKTPNENNILNKNQMEHFLKRFKINAIVDEIEIRFTSDINDDNTLTGEVLFIICNHFAFSTSIKEKGINIWLHFNNIQIDNPLFLNGGYDFPVFLLKQNDCDNPNYNNDKNRESRDLSDSLNLDFIIEEMNKNHFLLFNIDMEIWEENNSFQHCISDVRINLQPIRVYLEDTYLSALLDYVTTFFPSYAEISCSHMTEVILDTDVFVPSSDRVLFVSFNNIPEHILWESLCIANPIKLRKLSIDSINMLLSVHTSALFYIAFDHSPLQFGCFDKTNILTSSYRLGHALTMHYLSEAIFGAGWVVGSLEILGSPGGLARRVGAGLRDLVREPCRGLMRGPWPFLVGVTHGSASLIKHVTQGTVESMSMVMGSVARNLDRLSLDQDHMKRTERERRMQPNGIGQALSRGFRGLGLSLLGAIGGIAHETIVVGCERGGTPTALAAGLTRGLIGAVTKPLSATADLLALAGHGLLNQAGWDPHPQVLWRHRQETFQNQSSLIKLGPSLKEENLLCICQMTDKDTGLLASVIVTNSWLIIVDTESEKVRDMIEIKKICSIKENTETGDITIIISQNGKTSELKQNKESQEQMTMDPVCRARVAAFIGIVEESTKAQKIYRFKTSPKLTLHYVNILKIAYYSLYDNYWFSVL